jgi:hypothetical protein
MHRRWLTLRNGFMTDGITPGRSSGVKSRGDIPEFCTNVSQLQRGKEDHYGNNLARRSKRED